MALEKSIERDLRETFASYGILMTTKKLLKHGCIRGPQAKIL